MTMYIYDLHGYTHTLPPLWQLDCLDSFVAVTKDIYGINLMEVRVACHMMMRFT